MKEMRRADRIRSISLIFLITVFSALVGYRLGIAQTSFFKTIIEPGSMVTEASYIIFTDGTNVYARNGLTGEIEFSGADAGEVINNAISQLPSGGKVFINPGEYIVSTTILVDKQGISLEGSFGATKLIGTGDFPIISVNGLGSSVRNLVIKGPGKDYGIGIYTEGWEISLDGLIIGSVKYGIYVAGEAPRTQLSHIIIEPIAEYGLSNTYTAIYYDYPGAGAGWLTFWKDIDAGFCESDVIRIGKADSIWAINLRLLESGGHGLAIYGSSAYSNFANVQIDRMHGDALHLENMWETSFDGLWTSTNPSYDGRSIYISNSRGIDITSLHVWSGNPPVYIQNSYWVTLNTGVVLIEANENFDDAIIIENTNAAKLIGLVVHADKSSGTGIKYIGSPQPQPIKIIGSSVSDNFSTKINVAAEPDAVIIGSP